MNCMCFYDDMKRTEVAACAVRREYLPIDTKDKRSKSDGLRQSQNRNERNSIWFGTTELEFGVPQKRLRMYDEKSIEDHVRL